MYDTPGHKQFIRSMIQGISSNVDIACLVIGASQNEFNSSFERGQTKEHLTLARCVGILKLVVCINKMDQIKWDREIFDKHCGRINEFLKTLDWRATFIPMSGLSGEGLIDVKNVPEWSSGSLMGTLENLKSPEPKGKVTESKTERYKFKIFQCPNVITSGYRCILHSEGREVEIEIVGMKVENSTKRFAKSGDIITCKIEPESLDFKGRCILRSNDITIGYGKLQ